MHMYMVKCLTCLRALQIALTKLRHENEMEILTIINYTAAKCYQFKCQSLYRCLYFLYIWKSNKVLNMKRDVPRDFQDVSILSFSVLTRAVSLSTTDSLQLVQLHCFFDYSHCSTTRNLLCMGGRSENGKTHHLQCKIKYVEVTTHHNGGRNRVLPGVTTLFTILYRPC